MATSKTSSEPKVEKVWVRTVNAPMLHLYTNTWLTHDPKKVEVDAFVRAQLEAGKLVVVDEP